MAPAEAAAGKRRPPPLITSSSLKEGAMLGPQDLWIGLALGVFFFGAKKLPELSRSIGQSHERVQEGRGDRSAGRTRAAEAVAERASRGHVDPGTESRPELPIAGHRCRDSILVAIACSLPEILSTNVP